MKLKIGLRLLSTRDSQGVLPVALENEEGTVAAFDKDEVRLEFERIEKGEKKIVPFIWDFEEHGDMKEFSACFSVMKMQGFEYDYRSIWIAPDGGGDYYAYDSESEAEDYCKRTDESGPWSIARGAFDVNGPEMFVLLRHIFKAMELHEKGHSKMLDLLTLKDRVGKVLEAVMQDEKKFEQIIKALKIKEPK